MFCSNCGTPLNEKDKFCPKCGKPAGVLDEKIMDMKEKERNIVKKHQIGVKEIVLGLCCFILLIVWSDVCFSNLKNTRQLFGLMEESKKIVGMICYLGLYAYVAGITISILYSIKTGKYKAKYAIELLAVSILIKLGDEIMEMSLAGFKMIAFRIFLVYGSVWKISLIVSVVICFLVFSQLEVYRERNYK